MRVSYFNLETICDWAIAIAFITFISSLKQPMLQWNKPSETVHHWAARNEFIRKGFHSVSCFCMETECLLDWNMKQQMKFIARSQSLAEAEIDQLTIVCDIWRTYVILKMKIHLMKISRSMQYCVLPRMTICAAANWRCEGRELAGNFKTFLLHLENFNLYNIIAVTDFIA